MHWRHERLSVAMALADALHHSAQPRAKPEEAEQYDALRRQMTPPDREVGVSTRRPRAPSCWVVASRRFSGRHGRRGPLRGMK